MGIQNSGIENIFLLLNSETIQDKESAQKLKSSFLGSLGQIWKEGDTDLKKKLIHLAGELEIENGLRPVILGLKDHVLEVRNEAKKTLEKTAQQAIIAIRKGQDLSPDVVGKSVRFSFAIYKELKATKDLVFTKNILHTLLNAGGRGPFFAWKFFTQRILPQNIIIEIIRKLPEVLQLNFIQQYTLDDISVRRHYDPLVRSLLKDIKDHNAVFTFLADLFERDVFLDPLFDGLCKRLRIEERVAKICLRAGQENEKIKGLKVFGALDKISGYYSSLPLLSKNELPSVRVECLKMLAGSKLKKDPKITETVSKLLDDKNQDIILNAIQTLASLESSDLKRVAYDLSRKYPLLMSRAYEYFGNLDWKILEVFLNALPPDQALDARSAIAHKIIRNNPEKLIIFLDRYREGSNDKARKEAAKLLEKVDSIREKENKEASRDDSPEPLSSGKGKRKKGFFETVTRRKRTKELKKLIKRETIENAEFQEEDFFDLNLSGIKLRNANFEATLFSNVDLSDAELHSVTFRGARFENVKMENALLDSVSFEDAVIKGLSTKKASFRSCDFTNSWIYGSSFESSNMKGSLFTNAKIKETNFSQSDLTETSFVGSDLSKVSFNFANLDLSEFSLAQARFCDFSGVDFSTVGQLRANLNANSSLSDNIVIPSFFFENDLLKAGGFSVLTLTEKMDKQREAFLEYNRLRTDFALDTFRPEQEDLFELIPFLVHSDLGLLPTDNPIQNSPAGIYDYHPSPKVLQLARKYFIIDEYIPFSGKERHIEGLFTIGSIGTIAQSADSDIDYWVCVEKDLLGEKGIKLLHAKLMAIEEWATETFNTELHFFVVDIASTCEDRFGGSDQESSGSAQGKILKEEFYRTMMLVAGKIPLWCVIPPWLNNKHYQYFISLTSRFHKDYLNLGNVSTIPKGEYFGASIWQISKSLKSPYKSVMKMSLLEKYMQEEEQTGLLCNRLKAQWLLGEHDLRNLDPYLLLFKEVLDYYQRAGQKKAESLLKVCFFLKLGIKSIADLDKSVIRVRKKVVLDYIDRWNWNEIKVQDLGHFREWPFDKIFKLGTMINHYIIETYKKLGRSLQETTVEEAMITPEDLTILGRNMFVQFSKQPHRVEKLPLVFHGKSLFQQLHIKYRQPREGPALWSLHHLERDGQRDNSGDETLKTMERIEEIAIWLVHNGLYLPSTSFQLMPNSTPISLQDILDLLQKLNQFFSSKDTGTISPQALLKNSKVNKLLIAVNFGLSRQLKKINEYTVFYMTSWGELYCKVFSDKKGINSVGDALNKAKKQLGLPLLSCQMGVFIPRSARKRIHD